MHFPFNFLQLKIKAEALRDAGQMVGNCHFFRHFLVGLTAANVINQTLQDSVFQCRKYDVESPGIMMRYDTDRKIFDHYLLIINGLVDHQMQTRLLA